MSNQRIHLFKVFRGSSVARAKKALSCSFISKSSSTDQIAKPPEKQITQEKNELQPTQLLLPPQPNKNSSQQSANIENSVTKQGLVVSKHSLLSKEESLRYIYREQDSELSSPKANQIHEMKMQLSSIEIDEGSGWIDYSKTPASKPRRKLSIQRMQIEEQKLKLQIQKSQLERKRKQIQMLMTEYERLKSSCQRTHEQQYTLTERQMGQVENRPFKRLAKPKFTERIKTEAPDYSNEDLKTKQERIRKEFSILHRNQQVERQQRARKVLLLQTLWINLIKNNNQIRNINSLMVKDAFFMLKNLHRTKTMVGAIDSAYSIAALMLIGQAFVRIKKANIFVSKPITLKKNISIKFTKKQLKENQTRMCQTQSSRIWLGDESVGSSDNFLSASLTGCLTISADFNNTLRGSTSRVSEIDSIIKAEIQKRKTRTHRQLSIDKKSGEYEIIDVGFKKSSKNTNKTFGAESTEIPIKTPRTNIEVKVGTPVPSSARLHYRNVSSILRTQKPNQRVFRH